MRHFRVYKPYHMRLCWVLQVMPGTQSALAKVVGSVTAVSCGLDSFLPPRPRKFHQQVPGTKQQPLATWLRLSFLFYGGGMEAQEAFLPYPDQGE